MYKTLWWISKYLIFVNAAINPMIYGLTNEKFRRALKNTAISKFLYPVETKKKLPVGPVVKKKTTKETDLTNKNKIFYICQGPNVKDTV